MTLPPVTPSDISAAMVRFDNELRSTEPWAKWEENHSHRFAVKWNGSLYPAKQVIALATGVPVSSFSGGVEPNSYLKERGFEIEPLHLPTESDIKIALHELLLKRVPSPVSPQDAYRILADQFGLPERLRTQLMENSNEIRWENRIRFARRKLVDAAVLDGSEQGVWRLKVRQSPRIWVEKVKVEGRPDRKAGEYALGKAIWSPQRDRSGADEYGDMRLVQPGDLVIHLIDKGNIAGVSKAASYADMNFKGLPGTAWAGADGYLIRLEDFKPCEPPLKRQDFLENPEFATSLRNIRAAHKNLFYDRDLNLNQGFYISRAPEELVALLNSACITATGNTLPHIKQSATPLAAAAPGFSEPTGELPVIAPQTQKIWLYAPGRDAEHWDDFYREGIIAIGWDELGDLSAFHDSDEVTEKIREIYNRDNPMNDALACFEFANTMRPGDLVFAKRGRSRIVGYGTVLGDYRFEPGRDDYRHIRRIRWDARGDWTFEQMFAMKTLTEITEDEPLVAGLQKLVGLVVAEDEPEAAPLEDRTPYGTEDALDGLFIAREDFERILGIWKAKQNLIIQGPPGVGKTFIAKRLAYALMKFKDPSRVGMVQFHQAYSYEDFVQGYRPTPLGLALKDGLFLEVCRRATRDRDASYVFIIDEINRGNLSRIFGELMMLIEADKRDSGWSMPLTYANSLEAQFFVPDNVYIMGLMNTADRSLAMVDYALRRRFAFWNLKPQIGSSGFQQLLGEQGLTPERAAKLITTIEAINKLISDDTANLGPGYQIGHSYFCQEVPEEMDPTVWLRGVVETELIPLLEEYWVDDPGLAQKWSGELMAVLGHR
jgi:hypothetical protein